MELSDQDIAVLNFEATHPRHSGGKEELTRNELGMSPARYYQLLGRLIDSPAALQHDPLLVHRLRRIRDEQARQRWSRAASSGSAFTGSAG